MSDAKTPTDEAADKLGWIGTVNLALKRVARTNPVAVVVGACAAGLLYWTTCKWDDDRVFQRNIYLQQTQELEQQNKTLQAMHEDAKVRDADTRHYQERMTEANERHTRMLGSLLDRVTGGRKPPSGEE